MRTSLVVGLLGLVTTVLPAVATEPKSAAEAMEKGKACFEKGDNDGAVAAYTEAINLDPKNAEAYCGRGRAYGVKDELDKAILDFTSSNSASSASCCGIL